MTFHLFRALFVKNLRSDFLASSNPFPPIAGTIFRLSVLLLSRTSYNVTPEELFDLFGKFGPVRCTYPCLYPAVEVSTRIRLYLSFDG